MDMRKTNEERRESISGGPSLDDAPKYPYGLTIELDQKQLKSLGIDKTPTIDQVFNLKIVSHVRNVNKQEGEGDDSGYSVSLQITDIEVQEKKEDGISSDTFYKDES